MWGKAVLPRVVVAHGVKRRHAEILRPSGPDGLRMTGFFRGRWHGRAVLVRDPSKRLNLLHSRRNYVACLPERSEGSLAKKEVGQAERSGSGSRLSP
jgi:hypothetical protein